VSDQLWRGVDALIDRSPSTRDLRYHGLQLLAARRAHALGRPAPDGIDGDQRIAALAVATAPVLVRRLRELLPGPLLVLKGPEAAALYPEPTLRPFKDIDLMVDDAEAAQRTLVAAGFKEVGNPALYEAIHHLRPLRPPGHLLLVELHERPNVLQWMTPPSPAELMERAVPSVTGVEGVDALHPVDHALVLAVHGWVHSPLRRALDLVDAAASAAALDPDELADAARRWSMSRVWRTTGRAADHVLLGRRRRRPWTLRAWAHALPAAREQTVMECHLERIVSPFAALPPHRALRPSRAGLSRAMTPWMNEGWRAKLSRSVVALRNGARPVSSHHEDLRGSRSRR
jgi:hypothetical protein